MKRMRRSDPDDTTPSPCTTTLAIPVCHKQEFLDSPHVLFIPVIPSARDIRVKQVAHGTGIMKEEILMKWLKRWRRSMTVEGIEESRQAHRRILLSSCGGATISGKDGKMQIGHIDTGRSDSADVEEVAT